MDFENQNILCRILERPLDSDIFATRGAGDPGPVFDRVYLIVWLVEVINIHASVNWFAELVVAYLVTMESLGSQKRI